METFIEIAPKKDKEVCANCKHWGKWGVHTGTCLNRHSPNYLKDTNQNETCDRFEVKTNEE